MSGMANIVKEQSGEGPWWACRTRLLQRHGRLTELQTKDGKTYVTVVMLKDNVEMMMDKAQLVPQSTVQEARRTKV